MKAIKLILCAVGLSSLVLTFTSFTKGGSEKEEVDPEIFYSMGEVKAMSPDSIPYGTYVAITKEVMNKKENLITMKSITIDQKGETVEYN